MRFLHTLKVLFALPVLARRGRYACHNDSLSITIAPEFGRLSHEISAHTESAFRAPGAR